jgi:hypothetical protein
VLRVDPEEPSAGNALRIGERLVYQTGFPATARCLEGLGIRLEPVDVSERRKRKAQ